MVLRAHDGAISPWRYWLVTVLIASLLVGPLGLSDAFAARKRKARPESSTTASIEI